MPVAFSDLSLRLLQHTGLQIRQEQREGQRSAVLHTKLPAIVVEPRAYTEVEKIAGLAILARDVDSPVVVVVVGGLVVLALLVYHWPVLVARTAGVLRW